MNMKSKKTKLLTFSKKIEETMEGDPCQITSGSSSLSLQLQILTMVKTNGKEFLPSLSIYRFFGSFQNFTTIYLFWNPNYFIESEFLVFTLYSFGKLAFNVFFEFFWVNIG